jgi:hypothetical protein
MHSPLVQGLTFAFKWTFLPVLLLGIVGVLFSDFVPTHSIAVAAEILAVLAALVYGTFFAVRWRDLQFAKLTYGWNVFRNPYVAVPAIALTMYLLALIGFSSALPWAVNAVIGAPGSMQATVSGWERAGGRNDRCARPTLTGLPFGTVGHRAMCHLHISQESVPPGTHVILSGKSSAFGVSPDSLDINTGSGI